MDMEDVLDTETFRDILWQQQQSMPRNGNNGDPWFPVEILTIMGEFLAAEREFSTLSRLNRASRALREETLPVLYETVKIETEEAFTECLQYVNPNGFKYTRYLFLSETTLALLKLHQRYLHKFAGHAADGSDLKAIFPKLVFVAISAGDSDRQNRYRSPSDITLYKSISVADLLQVCAPGPSTGVAFFGAHLSTPATRQITRRRQPAMYSNITRLSLKPGARLLRDDDDRVNILSSKRTITSDSSFSLTLTEDTSADDASYIVQTVLGHLRSFVQAQEKAKVVQPVGGVRFKMSCSPLIFEQFMETFKELQPFWLMVDIELQGMSKTRDDIQRYITTLADIYASAWSHKPTREGQIFAHIEIGFPVPPEWHLLGEEDEANAEDEEAANITGELVIGWHEDNAEGHLVSHSTGFSAVVAEGLTVNGQYEHGEQLWEQAFPMNEVHPILPGVMAANNVV